MKVLNEIRESLAGSEQSEAHALYESSTGMNLPVVLILKRKALRHFPDGQIVALYYSDQLDKFITVPHSAIGISEEVIDEAVSDREKKRLYAIEVILSNYQKKLIPKHTALRQLKDKDVVNPEDMLGEEFEILAENPYNKLRNTYKKTQNDMKGWKDRLGPVTRGAARAGATLAIGGAVGTGAKLALGAGAAALKYGSKLSQAAKRTADKFRNSRSGNTSGSTRQPGNQTPGAANNASPASRPRPDASKRKEVQTTNQKGGLPGGKTATFGAALGAGAAGAAAGAGRDSKNVIQGLKGPIDAPETSGKTEVGTTSRGNEAETPINRGVERKTPEERKAERIERSKSAFDSHSSRRSVAAGRRSAEWFRDRFKRESFDDIFKELEDENITHIILEDNREIVVDYPILSSIYETYKELNETNQNIMIEKMKTIDGFYLIADFSLNR